MVCSGVVGWERQGWRRGRGGVAEKKVPWWIGEVEGQYKGRGMWRNGRIVEWDVDGMWRGRCVEYGHGWGRIKGNGERVKVEEY